MNQNTKRSQSVEVLRYTTTIWILGHGFTPVAAAAFIFIYHLIVDLVRDISDLSEVTFVLIYPCCFIASLALGIIRIMNFIPNPTPIIPVTISVVGWLAMLSGAVLAMRHAQLNLEVNTMTDDEIANSPIFKHDLMLCAMSLVGSTAYLVHAWLCYDCWCWDKRMSKLRETEDIAKTSSGPSSESDSGMSSNDGTEPNYQPTSQALELPGTSSGQDKSRRSGYWKLSGKASRLLNKFRKKEPSAFGPEEDPFATLNEILQSSIHVEQTRVEDEPVRLYCCCVEIGNIIKHEYMTNPPVHEFQVVHVM